MNIVNIGIGDIVKILDAPVGNHEIGNTGEVCGIGNYGGFQVDCNGEKWWYTSWNVELVKTNPFTRRDEALAFLRGALSRCNQEGVPFVDAVRIVKSWADAKNIAYEQPVQPEWVAILPDRSNRPAVGDVVKSIGDTDNGNDEYWHKNETGVVTKIDNDYCGTRVEFSQGKEKEVWFVDECLLVQYKLQPKPKTIRYERLTDDSPLPAIGAKVRIEGEPMFPHEIGDIGVVTHIGGTNKNYIGVRVENHPSGNEPEWNWEYYFVNELSLVIEE